MPNWKCECCRDTGYLHTAQGEMRRCGECAIHGDPIKRGYKCILCKDRGSWTTRQDVLEQCDQCDAPGRMAHALKLKRALEVRLARDDNPDD